MAIDVNKYPGDGTFLPTAVSLASGEPEAGEVASAVATMTPPLLRAIKAGRDAIRAHRLRKGWMPNGDDNGENNAYQQAYWEIISTLVAALEEPSLGDEAQKYAEEVAAKYNEKKGKNGLAIGEKTLIVALEKAQTLMKNPALKQEFEESLKEHIARDENGLPVMSPLKQLKGQHPSLLTADWEGIEEHPNGKQLIIYYSLDIEDKKVQRFVGTYKTSDKRKATPERLTDEQLQAILKGLRGYDTKQRFVFKEAKEGQKAYLHLCSAPDLQNVKKDEKKTKDIYYVKGFAGYPNSEGSVLAINWQGVTSYNHPDVINTLIHEAGHVFGAPHTHRGKNEDVPNPDLPGHLNSLNYSSMAYEKTKAKSLGHAGGASSLQPVTAQIGDILFMAEHYAFLEGLPRLNPKTHVLPGLESGSEIASVGTYELYDGDVVEVRADKPSVLNLFQDINEPSISGDHKAWFYEVPMNKSHGVDADLTVKVFTRDHIMKFKEDTDVHIVGGDQTLLPGDRNYIDLGEGKERIILPVEAGAIISMKDFDPLQDEVLYPENTTSYKVVAIDEKDREKGSIVELYSGDELTHQVVLHGVNSRHIGEQNFREVTQKQLQTLKNMSRNFIELEKSNSGKIQGYQQSKHALQYNLPEDNDDLEYYFLAVGGETNIWIYDKLRQPLKQVIKHNPPTLVLPTIAKDARLIPLYHNGRRLKGEGSYRYSSGVAKHESWAKGAKNYPYYYLDFRSAEKSTSEKPNSVVLDANEVAVNSHRPLEVRTNMMEDGMLDLRHMAHAVPYVQNKGPAAVNMVVDPYSAEYMAMDEFRVGRDSFYTDLPEVDIIPFQGKTVIVFSGNEINGDGEEEKVSKYLMVHKLVGDPKNISFATDPYEDAELQVTLHEEKSKPPKEFSDDITHLDIAAHDTRERLHTKFPELRQQKAAGRNR